MIDIKELRRLAQAALAAPDGLSAEWMDRLGQFQEAADASVVSELLDRLEAAEKSDAESLAMYRKARDERDTYKAAYNEWIAKTEWVQDELTCSKLPAKYLGMHRADGIKVEIDALRAKIEQMERQEPYSYIYEYANPIDGSPVWRDTPGYWNAQYPRSSKPLYALPGAQPAPSTKDAIIDDLQSQFDSDGITEHDSGDALIRLSDAIAAVEDNFAQPAPSLASGDVSLISEGKTQPTLSVPEGWRLVPIEFLEHVIGLCTHHGSSPESIESWDKEDKWVADLWRQAREMLAAAPEAKP